jgi:dihydrodipicolinate synthase/N-acetylneuraminate lyase
MGTSKALMHRLGVNVGPARAPLDNPSPAAIDALIVKLRRLGFDDWGAKAR